MSNLIDDVAAGSTNLESQLTRSAASAPSEYVPNAVMHIAPSENVPKKKAKTKLEPGWMACCFYLLVLMVVLLLLAAVAG